MRKKLFFFGYALLLILSACLAGCSHLKDLFLPSAYKIDNFFIDEDSARLELLRGYKGYAGKVVKVSPINGGNWSDNSRSLYWEWELHEPEAYKITISMSVMVEKPKLDKPDKPVISAYRPRVISFTPTSIKRNGPGNIGWVISDEDNFWEQFGGKALEAPEGQWVDLTFSQAYDFTSAGTYQISIDGHNDDQGLIDLTLYIRHFEVTVEKTNNFIALTFNDSPSDYTQFIIDKLENLGIKASFFISRMGINAEHPLYDTVLADDDRADIIKDRKEVVQWIAENGHEIGSFSYSGNLPPNEMGIRTELEATRLAIQKAVYGDEDYMEYPWVSKLFMMPPGAEPASEALIKEVAADMGLPIVDGTGSGSNAGKSANVIADRIMNEIKPWGIIINMDLRADSTVMGVLDILIPKLQSEGYAFLTISEMAERSRIDMRPGTVYGNLDPASN